MAFADIENSPASQEFVPIKEVRDGIAILNNGSLRSIMLASSINFALKSQEEKQAVISQFQNFLNTIDFSVQFSIQSREIDIEPYLDLLESQYRKEENPLLQTQIREYTRFIEEFTEDADIMRKAFFVVVPYNRSVLNQDGGLLDSISDFVSGNNNDNGEGSFEEARTQLQQRVGIVEQGLVRTGVRVTQLKTEEAIELFYQLMNPTDLKTSVEDSSI